MQITKSAVVLSLSACAVLAQQGATPAFEVASVKVSAPFVPSPQGGQRMIMRGCGKPDPAMVHCTGVTLRMLLMRAYEVKTYQIEGPAWLNTETYDVMAKVPDGVAADRVPAMLQALLAERFGVKLHKETRVLPAYDLSVGKGGPKMKEVDVAKLPGMPEPGSAPPPLPPPGGRGGGPPALSSMPVGAMMFMIGGDGSRMVRGNMTMEQLATHLTGSLNRPVFDNTGLKGTYEVELSYLGDENDGMGFMPAGGPPPGAVAGRGDAASRQQPDATTPIATLSQAVQQTLGLKLDSKKAPVEMIVIESANKVPTEN